MRGPNEAYGRWELWKATYGFNFFCIKINLFLISLLSAFESTYYKGNVLDKQKFHFCSSAFIDRQTKSIKSNVRFDDF